MRSNFLILVYATLAAGSPFLSERDSCPGVPDPNYFVYAINPAPNQKFVCGKRGTVASPSPLNTLPSCSTESLNSCRDSCLGRSRCLSFQFDSTTSTCNLYAKPLNQQGFAWTPKKQTNPIHYARACFGQAYVAEYIDNGDFEDGYYSGDDEQSNTHSIPWFYANTGTNDPYIGPHQQYSGYPLSLQAYCRQRDVNNEPCVFTIYQDIDGPISKGAYTLAFQALATYSPGFSPLAGITITPRFNGQSDTVGDPDKHPCQADVSCPYYNYDTAQFTNYTAQWSSPGGLTTSRISFDVTMSVGWSMGLDNVSFKWTGTSLSSSPSA